MTRIDYNDLSFSLYSPLTTFRHRFIDLSFLNEKKNSVFEIIEVLLKKAIEEEVQWPNRKEVFKLNDFRILKQIIIEISPIIITLTSLFFQIKDRKKS